MSNLNVYVWAHHHLVQTELFYNITYINQNKGMHLVILL